MPKSVARVVHFVRHNVHVSRCPGVQNRPKIGRSKVPWAPGLIFGCAAPPPDRALAKGAPATFFAALATCGAPKPHRRDTRNFTQTCYSCDGGITVPCYRKALFALSGHRHAPAERRNVSSTSTAELVYEIRYSEKVAAQGEERGSATQLQCHGALH